MSIKDGLIFREMAQRLAVTAALVEQLLEEVATQQSRIEALEATAASAGSGQAECPRCETHRQANAERVRRHRNITKRPDGAIEPAMAETPAA